MRHAGARPSAPVERPLSLPVECLNAPRVMIGLASLVHDCQATAGYNQRGQQLRPYSSRSPYGHPTAAGS